MPAQTIKAQFVEPMMLLPASELPAAQEWTYQLKLDGYRAIAIKSEGKVQLRSRNNKDFNGKYPGVVNALRALPDETVIDGEIVALDETGRPSFNALQNFGSSGVPIFYYVFDLLVLKGQNLMSEQLSKRRDLLRRYIIPKVNDPIRECPELNASLADVIIAVRAQGLEGVVAKNLNSLYEPGRRSGAWRKMRINKGQEFVIGGYTTGPKNFDAVIFGYYADSKLLYAGRTRNGFVFFAHGAQKMLVWFGGDGFTSTMGYFTGMMHIPAALAFLAIAAEFLGGIGLIVGFLTRIAAFGIGVSMSRIPVGHRYLRTASNPRFATCHPASRQRDATAEAPDPVPIAITSNFLGMFPSSILHLFREAETLPLLASRLWNPSFSFHSTV